MSYREEVYNLKQWEDQTMEELDIWLTNILVKCDYPQDQMGTWKVKVMFNSTKHFEIKQYVREQPLTLTYQTLLNKSKIYERSSAYYKK